MFKTGTILSIFILSLLLLSCSKSEDVVKSSLAQMDSFKLYELKDCVFEFDGTTNYTALVEEGTALNSFIAIFTLSDNAVAYIGGKRQTSGVTQNDFSAPVQYQVVAEDGTSKQYTITVHTDGAIRSFSIVEMPNVTFQFNAELNEYSAQAFAQTDLSNLTALFEIPDDASLFIGDVEQVSGETKNSFVNTVDYTLKMDDGLEKEYSVSIYLLANQAPTAEAGTDLSLFLVGDETEKQVTLDASKSSDPETANDQLIFSWKKDGVEISDQSTVTVTLSEGNHTFELTVTDEIGENSTDEVGFAVSRMGNPTAVDAEATIETKNLLKSLHGIANSSQFLFGQEFPLSFQLKELRRDLSTSDCKEVAGDHPAVFGIDPHYMLYKSADQRQVHIEEAKYAYNNGAVVTFDFHQQSKNDHKIYLKDISNTEDKSLMYDIVHDLNGARTFFKKEMDEIVDIINNDLGFPVVLRLYHEMDGGWFWWGSSSTNASTELYQEFYQYAVNYIKGKTNLVLFAWSPNGELRENYYPGDAYVDVVGFDSYGPSKLDLKTKLIELSTFAAQHNKVAALTETGAKGGYVNSNATFWTKSILSAIEEGGENIRIAWVLAWFNAPWTEENSDLFIPNAESPEKAKADFVSFKQSNTTLFLEDIKAMNIY